MARGDEQERRSERRSQRKDVVSRVAAGESRMVPRVLTRAVGHTDL